MDVRERFARAVQSIDENDCWVWGLCHDRDGYARFHVGGRPHLAHRISYELYVGVIPAGLTVDHVCRNRGCVNPAHLEAVTFAVNMERAQPFRVTRTHCVHGHPFDEPAAYGKNRRCKPCNKAAVARYRLKKASV